MDTLFAPAVRENIEAVRASFASLKAHIPYDAILDLVPSVSIIINAGRQVLYANAAAISSLGLDTSEIIGSRPGEILKCVHAAEMPGGCGTAESCRVCGAVNTILEALESGVKTEKECRITIQVEGKPASLDLRVTAVPIASTVDRYVVVTLVDISDMKRRKVLERLFFHDMINSLSSLQSGIYLIKQETGPLVSGNEYFASISATTDRLIDEVLQQKGLFSLENGDLEVECEDLPLGPFAGELIRNIGFTEYAKGKRIVLRDTDSPVIICTDPVLLRRVLLNMLKNALEATGQGGEIGLDIEDSGSGVRISVRNQAFIPRELQLQIFQRSFSTKGPGRGLGTYSVRMLTEEYLKGKAGFSSDEREGTTFWILLPKPETETLSS